MKKLFSFIMLIPLLSFGQTQSIEVQITTTCYKLDQIKDTLIKFDEKLILNYPNDLTNKKTNIQLFTNKETGTWTLFELIDGLYCLLGTGTVSTL